MLRIIRRGSVIEDNKGQRYLVVLVQSKIVYALDQNFNPVSIGRKLMHQFKVINNVDISFIINFLKGDINENGRKDI